MITKDYLKEHFRKHDSITLYKTDGTPVTISKRYYLVMQGGHTTTTFKTYEELAAFYSKRRLCLKPIINVG